MANSDWCAINNIPSFVQWRERMGIKKENGHFRRLYLEEGHKNKHIKDTPHPVVKVSIVTS
ncbi:hypothetical protein DPMN_169679 [Dreissena polymorpha]|uniref:Uncharacterized protein n=1 Tax=Dreissena polymorpha TaxID=45954 RepID=A0A9D4DVP0_DREPO|nr:hypothetical protein DPMN_169679 [Dreissena polymorpha]